MSHLVHKDCVIATEAVESHCTVQSFGVFESLTNLMSVAVLLTPHMLYLMLPDSSRKEL